MNCIEQVIGENYALYHGDCVEVLKGIRFPFIFLIG